MIVVEPESAACVMESIKTGKLEKVNITRESLMGGMSCGEPSLVPWKILKKSVNNCISLPDHDIGKAMKLFANASFGDDKIIAGENSAPGVISLIASSNDENIKNKLNLNSNSNSIGFRVPALRLARDLLMQTGPLATTSANISGKSPVKDALEA